MSKEKQKARKLRERKERIRLEKHARRSLPPVPPAFQDEPEDLPQLPAGRFATEQGLHDLHKVIGDRVFESAEEANRFITSAMEGGRLKDAGRRPKDDRELARDLAYQAMDAYDPGEIERLARLALRHDPECVDALRMLAFVTAKSPEQRMAMMRETVRIAERVLGPACFEEYRGRFWGILETRPYMRARLDLAEALSREGAAAEALGHFEALLELNQYDNQGVRYTLAPLYLETGKLEAARKLLGAYPNDYSAAFHWCRVLERWLSRDLDGAAKALAGAREMNPHVEVYLSGHKLPPRQPPDRYSPGKPSEAAVFARDLRNCWLVHRGAVAWLREQSPRTPGKA